MKTIIIASVVILFSMPGTHGQTLSDFYKNETVKLEEVSEYSAMTDWDELFSDYTEEWRSYDVGRIKSIAMAPDGSVFMSHRTHYEIWKFDRNGKFVKAFGSKGNGKGEFILRASVEGVLGGKYVITTDVQGRMSFFDLDGNYVKSLKLDYMPLQMVPLGDMKIAIFGHVPWHGHRVKNIIAIKDFETGKEHIVWQVFRDLSSQILDLPGGKKMVAEMNFTPRDITRHGLAASSEGTLLVASNRDGKVVEYSTDGKELRSFPLKITPVEVTDADVQRIYEKQIENFAVFNDRLHEERRLTEKELELIKEEYTTRFETQKDKIKAGDHLPVYSTVIMDSDGNVLVFEFTEEKDSNKFKVYSYNQKGALLGVSSFECPGYDLSFTNRTFVFHGGYVYAVATKKNVEGIPLRLVKFKLAI
ncbi:MAG: 6-bladed beta-propeller [Bacteroidales bacterium]|nr:6-bladed beta-propeller [Bacteroidales bacterium]